MIRQSPHSVLARRVVAAAAAVGVVVALVFALRAATGPAIAVGCVATVGGVGAELSPEQMGHAATIAGIAVRRGLPARAATIAIATAMQESKLVNVEYGDRDSLGLFQQRPSQGWGTKAQVLDPVHATNAFYDALVKVRAYRDRPITEVAQAVQRSGFPRAYAQHEAQARVLASALSGNSPAALTCALDPDQSPAGAAGVPRLASALAREQPRVTSAPLDGRPGARLTPRVGSVSATAAWAMAQWSVGQAERLGVARVYVDGRVWVRAEPDRGWTPAAGSGVPAAGSPDVVVLFTDTRPT